MENSRKFHRPPSNTVYEIGGASCGADEKLIDVVRESIRARLQAGTLEIPRLPQVAGRILQISRNPNFSADEAVRVIISDPLLAGRILTIANSAAYGGTRKIENLKQALMRLGLRMVRDIVFTESVRVRVFSTRSYRHILEQSWRLSLGTAVACEVLSRLSGLERDGAFLLGLLHDTGKPVLVNAICEYEKHNGNATFGDEIIEIVLSQLHEEIGAHVLDRWEMPPAIVDAAGGHHRYRGAANATPAHRLVYAGNLICQHLGIGDVQKDVDFTIEHVFGDLGLADPEPVSRILETVTREVQGLLGSDETAGLSEPALEVTPPERKPSPYRRTA